MSYHEKAHDFIKTLARKYGTINYIFRGTTTRYSLQKGEKGIEDGINSTLYRWVVKEQKEKSFKKLFTENPAFFPAVMEEEIFRNAGNLFEENTHPHEVLTDLQHFGGKTNMIDFSRSIYVALFFACQDNFEKNGELIALHKDKLKKIEEVNYAKSPESGTLEIIDPADAQSSKQRVRSQKSVFVRPADGYIVPKECDITKICAELKEPILDHLRTFHNVTESVIYNDLHGFIKNAKNNETASLYFYAGLASYNEGDNKKSIEHYGKSIKLNPNSPKSYNNLGNAYVAIKDYKPALENYDKAISLNRNYAEAHNGRGVVYKILGRYELAFENYNRAILLNPRYDDAFYNRGNAYCDLGDYKSAIADYDMSISINSNFPDVYYWRGLAKHKTGDIIGGNADITRAINRGFIATFTPLLQK